MASSVFSMSQNSSAPQFKVLPASSIRQSGITKENVERERRTSDSGPFIEAAARRVRAKEARAKAQRTQNDPRIERTIFIGNIPSCCCRKSIKKLLKGHGSIESIRLRSIKVAAGERPSQVAKRTQKQLQEGSSFNAYVVFSSVDEAENCLSLNGTLIHGRHLRVDRVDKKVGSPGEHQRSVFIGNLPFTADEEKMREIFSSCGDIEAVRIVRDSKSGVGKGFGFVKFVDKAGVMFAVRQNKKLELDGRLLRVSKYRGQQGQVLPSARDKKIWKRKTGQTDVMRKSSEAEQKQHKNGLQRLVATKYIGKRRPDGTKNRLYRLPPTSSE